MSAQESADAHFFLSPVSNPRPRSLLTRRLSFSLPPRSICRVLSLVPRPVTVRGGSRGISNEVAFIRADCRVPLPSPLPLPRSNCEMRKQFCRSRALRLRERRGFFFSLGRTKKNKNSPRENFQSGNSCHATRAKYDCDLRISNSGKTDPSRS